MNYTRGKGILENFLAKKRAKITQKHIKKQHRKGRILDIGCGQIPFFLINTKFNEKFGLDQIESKSNGIPIKKFDINKESILPFESNYFDTITMLAVFEHIEPEKLVNLMQEINRILKPQGRFILTTPCTWTDKLLRIMAKLNLVSKSEIEEHKDAYSHKQIKSILIKGNFKKQRIKTGYFEFFLNNWAYADKI